ncbi:protein SCO1/2 [Desulfopila aestuarii DSM 18488]|uniref:Protein SCO1/2 n=1 Tax=Desulfopila aestuarii DSM 18488 TaxID=1121416 RepID=A0A1M7YC60_9BACT|nr:protein SCO1/2 [Desulfopila aestuarii DSM 18488]
MPLSRYIQHLVVVLISFCCIIAAQADDQAVPLASDIPADTTGNAGRDWVVEKTGSFLPLDTLFVDENGNSVTLRSIIDRPTLILPIYFYCPSACSKNLANMAVAMNRMNFEPGRDYRAIALSFSDTETAENATRAKQNYLKLMYDGFPADSWTFLTGSADAIKSVTDAMGYRFKKMADGLFVHPSTVIAVGADGKIIRYVYGSFVPGDMDMAVSSALEGTPALSVKRFLEFCLSYDPDNNKPIFLYVKIGVGLFFGVGIGLIFYFGRKKKGK